MNLAHCDLPFDFAQGGGELVEPFDICDLLFFNFSYETTKFLLLSDWPRAFSLIEKETEVSYDLHGIRLRRRAYVCDLI